MPFALAAFEHWLFCTSHDRARALLSWLKAALPVTWNWLPTAKTVGAVTPPRAPVNVCRFPPLLPPLLLPLSLPPLLLLPAGGAYGRNVVRYRL